MFKFYALFLFLSINSNAITQNIPTDKSVPVVAYWQKNDSKTLSITTTTKKTQAGKEPVFAKNTCEAQLKITDSTAEGYTIEWTYKDAGNAVRNIPELSGINSLFTNLKIIYKTDDVGMFKELVNYEEVKTFLYKAMDGLFNMAKDTSGTAIVKKEFQKIFSSRESLEQLLLRDISLFHSAYGVEYSFKPQIVETSLPNFIGGDPWPAQLSLKLSKLNAKENFAQVQITQEIDEAKAAAIITEYLAKLSASQGKELPKEEIPSGIIIKDLTEFDIVLSSGWIKRAYMKRLAKVSDVEKLNTYEIIIK
jgi:hypothetical protein